MESAESGPNHDVRWKTAAFQLENVNIRTSPKQTTQADEVLRSLSPLINSMRPFGLYFTRRPRVACQTTNKQRVGRCREWNFARTYATIVLVVTWLNAFRYAATFDGTETLGAALFMKLGMIPAAFLNIVLQTAYYVACHTGSLDRVLRQASLSMVELSPKYGRRAKLVVVVVWILLAWNIFHYVYQLFGSGRLHDLALIYLSKTLPESSVYVVKTVFLVLHLFTLGTWLLPQAMKITVVFNVRDILFYSTSFKCLSNIPQAMNYMVLVTAFRAIGYIVIDRQVMIYTVIVTQAMKFRKPSTTCMVKVSQAMNYMAMVLLCDQFTLLNSEFGKCIGDRGQLSGNFEQFRRRHQAVSRSVQEADRFLMITNGVTLCCQVISFIIVLYNMTFYRDDTISLDAESCVLYIVWIGLSVFGISLVAGQAILLNHKVSIVCML